MTTAHLIEKIEHALVFYLFATPGHDQWGSSDIDLNLGRPGIIAIRVSSGVVRIHIATRAIRIVGIAAKTSSRPINRYFSCLSRFGGLGPNAGLAWRRQAVQM